MSVFMRPKSKLKRSADSAETLYRRVEQAIFSEIRAGKLKPGDRLGTAQALAERWQVSPSTIRQSLQMLASRGVVTRKPRVGTVVASDSESAEPPRGQASRDAGAMIALLLPDIAYAEFARLARAVQDVAHLAGMDVVIGSTDDELERYEEIIYRQVKSNIYGMVLVPPIHGHLSLEVLGEIQKRGIPAVTAFRDLSATGWPFVCTDVYHNKYIAGKHLCDVGCQHVAFIGYDEHSDLRYVKHYGFIRALMASGRTVSEANYLLLPEQSLNDSKDLANEVDARIERWLDAHREVDGISCSHDEIAYCVLRALRKLGREVPDEVAVVGEGNFGPYLGFDLDALTTVDLRFTEMAEKICGFLRARRNGEPVAQDVKVLVKGDLVRGRSTMRGGAVPAPTNGS